MNTVFEFPDHLKPIVSAVNKIAKQVAANYVINHEHPEMSGINQRIKVALQLQFGINKNNVPDFRLDSDKRDIVLTVAEWTSLLSNIESAFEASTPRKIRKGMFNDVPWV